MKATVEFADIQGLVRFAHAHLSEAAYLLLNVADTNSAKAWLREAPVSSAAKAPELPDSAVQVALSAKGLQALEVPQDVISEFSEEFIAGMGHANNRSRRLGDIGANAPENWCWGDPENGVPDILLMIYARPGELEAVLQSIKSAEFSKAFELSQTLATNNSNGREHFGFVDGISQPKIDWQQQLSVDLHERDRYANLLALGEVILGYPNEYGLYTDRPLIDPAQDPNAKLLPVASDNPQVHDLGKHGSYLVFRQLSQDVSKFWKFIDQATASDPEQRNALAAAMVGRTLDGQPLVELDQQPIQGINATSNNHFTYAADPHGLKCPIGSHVRRANPRTGDYPPGVNGLLSRIIRALGFKRAYPTDDVVAASRFHRVLRRGRPYGDLLSPEQALEQQAAADVSGLAAQKRADRDYADRDYADRIHAERGLHFICLGANISRQFEFVQSAWLASSKFAGLAAETDPLLGDREPLQDGSNTDEFTLPQKNAPTNCIAGLPQFVTVRGGAYFFMPGLAALQYIAAERPVSNNQSEG